MEWIRGEMFGTHRNGSSGYIRCCVFLRLRVSFPFGKIRGIGERLYGSCYGLGFGKYSFVSGTFVFEPYFFKVSVSMCGCGTVPFGSFISHRAGRWQVAVFPFCLERKRCHVGPGRGLPGEKGNCLLAGMEGFLFLLPLASASDLRHNWDMVSLL